MNVVDQSSDSHRIEENMSTPEQDYDFLRTEALSNDNFAEFQQKLLTTIDHRMKLLYDKMIDVKLMLPFFFVRPELVFSIYESIKIFYF